jgi:flagellar protein FlaH
MGNTEIDKKLGGGIPIGSLVLVEGQSDAGKSVVSQHLAYGGLRSNLSAAYYTTENTVKSLISQMESLNLDITDYFLCDRLRVYPLELAAKGTDSCQSFNALLQHFGTLPRQVSLLIIDSLTRLVAHSDDTDIIDFFAGCKQVCDHGRTVVAVVHSYAFDNQMLIRIRSLCDAHLVLKMEQVGERLIKVMEVAKVRNANKTTGNIISFDVEPGIGMRIIPVSKAKA